MSGSWPLHDALVELVYPTSLSLSPDGRRLAYVGAPGGPAVTVLDPTGSTDSATPTVWALEVEPVLVRWCPSGTRLWVVGVAEHGEPAELLLLDLDGTVVNRCTVVGAVEDVVPTGEGCALLRIADVGSERDGMHLGLKVRGASDPDPEVSRSTAPALRRLVTATAVDGRIELAGVDLDGWTVWDVAAVGATAVVVASREPTPAGYYRPAALVVDDLGAARPTVRELYRTHGQLACPRLSPDGGRVALLEGQSIVSGVVHLIDLATGTCRTVRALDDVTDLGWIDAETLWFAGWNDLGVQVGRIAVPGAAGAAAVGAEAAVLNRWTALGTMHGDAGQPSVALAPDGTTAYAVWDAPGHPPEVVALSLDEAGTSALTAHNAALVDAVDVVTEPLVWFAGDGTGVHGLLLRPSGVEGPMPLVALLHGGPTWLWSAAFAPAESNHLALALAAEGVAVLLPNPRGSSGRGQAYAAGVVGDMGGSDLDDVLVGVDHLVARGVADAERTAVMGLSYGGYLTAKATVTQPRFRAAVVMSGVADWLGFATTSAIGGGYDTHYHPLGGLDAAAAREDLVGRSPLYEVGPTGVPTLLLHGALDRITPLSQAEQLFGRLRRAGVDSELVVYPREGHELVEPTHRRDAAARVRAWLRDHGVLGVEEG